MARPFRILIASHGELAAALVSTAELIVGRLEGVRTLALGTEESPEAFAERARPEFAAGADSAILVLTDLYGGTPHNVLTAVGRGRPVDSPVHSIAGVNLGLLIEAATMTEELTADAVARLVERARRGLVNEARAASPTAARS